MTIFRVTITEDIKKTIVTYVDAPSREAADNWASMLNDAESAGSVTYEDDICGEVSDIQTVESVPPGFELNTISPSTYPQLTEGLNYGSRL